MYISRYTLMALFLTAICCWANCAYAQQPPASGNITDYYKLPDDGNIHPVKSRYDYKPLAEEITAGCTTNFERIKAIYAWITSHIEYDTSYKIRTADECLKKQKGVCQAYCELFYLLGKAVGIRVETIMGKAKDQTGFVNPNGHGWLFAYTSNDRGILMDPTWGAGSVDGDRFVPEENCWEWFNVAPEWMILSHFPQKASCQLLDKPLSEQEFMAMEPVKPIWMQYGLDLSKIYQRARNGKIVLPNFYNYGEGIVRLLDIPWLTSLRIGSEYTFRVKMLEDRDFAIVNHSVTCKKQEWTAEGDGVYTVKFIPRDTESLYLCIRDADGAGWNTIVKYDIATPTQKDWDLLAAYFPMSTPEMKAVQNLNVAGWGRAGIGESKLAQLIKENHVTELPVLFEAHAGQLTIETVPMNRILKANETYTFSIRPTEGTKWAIVNGQQWFTDWKVSDDGLHTIEVVPQTPGKLSLFVQSSGAESYWSCLEYEVRE